MVDNVSYVQGLAPTLVIIHHPHVSTASVSKGWGGLAGRIGLPAFAASTLSLGVLHGRLVYQIYLVYRELCLLVRYTCPIVLPLISGL